MDVDIDALERAATEFAEQAGALADLDVTTPFAGIGTALPGSLSGEAALWTSSRAAAAVGVLADRLEGLSRSAAGTAEGYRLVDGSSQRRFEGMVR
jgi:hypothetical protein